MRTRLAPLALVAALVFGACSEFRSDDPTIVGSPEPTEAPEDTTTDDTAADEQPDDAPGDTIDWESCGSAECATVAAPLNYDEPGGGTIDIFVKRIPATGERIGALFVNFGGPGGEASSSIDSWSTSLDASVTEHFDIVGMDPRGVGQSTPLNCGTPIEELYHADPTIEDRADARALLEASEKYVADCEAAKGDVLAHLGTRNVARDMDLIREGMGDDQLNYIGYSYGTSIGQAYAELFPDQVRTMVLDGLVDTALPGIEAAVNQAKGFETALRNWAAGCQGRPSCDLEAPIKAVEEVIELAEDEIPAGGDVVGPGEVAVATAFPLYAEFLWPEFDDALEDALDGDGTGLLGLARQYMSIADFSIYFAVSCLDSTWLKDTQRFMNRAKAAADVAPHFGEEIVIDYIRCALWPADPEPLGPITAPGAPPILVVSTTGDPATPYQNGVVVAERLESGVLVTNAGEGHTVVFTGKSCIDDLVIDYLVDETVPADDVTC